MKKPTVHRPDKCGKTTGWNIHARNDEEQCQPCRDAKAVYMSEWRMRTGRTEANLYTPADIALIAAQALREAADDANMFGTYGKGWLRDRAARIEQAA